MAQQILVPLRRDDRIEEIIPYVAKIAQPGMAVVFLTPYPVDPLEWWRGRRLSIEAEIQGKLAVKIAERYPWEEQRRLAEAKVFSASGALQKMGVTIAVDVYAGPSRKALRAYRNEDIDLAIMGARRCYSVTGLIDKLAFLLGLLKPNFPRGVLIQANHRV